MGRHADAERRARAELAAADAAVTSGLAAAAGAVDAARLAHHQVLARAVAQAHAALTSGRCEEHEPWDGPRWRSWTPTAGDPTEARLGAVNAAAGDLLPATVPLFDGRTVVLASSGPRAAEHARAALRGLAVRCAAALGPDAVVHLVDPYQEGYGFPERPHLPTAAPLARDAAAALSAVVAAARPDAPLAHPAGRQVVLAMDFPRGYGFQGVELVNRVARLAPAGVQLIVHHDLDADTPGRHDELDLTDPVVVSVHADGTAFGAWGAFAALLDAPPPAGVVAAIAPHLRRREAAATASGVLRWSDVNGVDPASWWGGDATREVRAVVGRDTAGRPVEIALGRDEQHESRAHVVIAGDTGSGKSVLLHALITSLATRYPPDQVRFYLLDGQDGAEFQAYARLPHADVVTVRTPVDLMRSVLTDVDAELTRRTGLLTDASGAAAGLGGEPRLLVVIDEYQRLFEGDRRDEAAGILQRIAAQGRKCGIHLVLASQRFHATGLLNQDALFANLRTRLSFRLPVESVDAVDEFDREGRALIRTHCTEKGRFVLNDRGGAAGGSVAGVAAVFDPEPNLALQEIRALVDQMAALGARTPTRPVVLDGAAQPDPADNRALAALSVLEAADFARLRAWATASARDGGLNAASWQPYDHPLAFITGRTLSVYGSAQAVVERRDAQHVLVVSDRPEAMTGMVLTGLASAALSVPAGQLRVAVLAQLPPPGPWYGALTDRLAALASARGQAVTWARTDADAVGLLGEAVAELDRRAGLEPEVLAACGPFLVVGVALDRRRPFCLVEGRYEAEPSAAGASLLRVLREGPGLGVHAVLGFESRAALDRVLPTRAVRFFTHRFVTQLSEEDSRRLLDSTFGYRVEDAAANAKVKGPDRAGYSNRVTGAEVVFLPYVVDDRLFTALTRFFDRGTR